MRTAFELAFWAFELAASVFAFSVFAYGVGSFVLMRPYTTSRTFGVSVRELLRETVLAVITQPFLPLYYFVGRRMEPLLMRSRSNAGGTPVIFVHGYMQNRVCFLGLARAFARKGVGPLYGINYPWFVPVDSNAERLERFVERVCEETKSPVVDLVCHSMGGLVAMEMIRREARGAHLKVRRCVTIATPHAGIPWRGPLIGFGANILRRGSKLLATHAGYTPKVPTLSLFSSHDNLVHPKETSYLVARGGRDIEVDGPGHLAILFSPEVAAHATSFLLEPGPEVARTEVVHDVADFAPSAQAG